MSSTMIIERYVVDELSRGSAGTKLGHDVDLLELGVFDSIAVVRLVDFLEKHFAIAIEDEDLVPENFQSITVIGALVARRLADRTADCAE